MKAQRRHELKTNTLAEAMAHLPNTGLKNAATGITIVLAGLLIGLLIRYRIAASQDRALRASDNLAVARSEIEQIKRMVGANVDPTQPGMLFSDVMSRLEAVIADAGSGNPALAAEALVARGDANWDMAGFSASTTQPSSSIESSADLLGGAETAYQQVIDRYPKQDFSASTARFGLAAIDEDRHDWEKARSEYQAVADDENAGDILHIMARGMLATLDQLQHPAVIAAATQPTTMTSPHE